MLLLSSLSPFSPQVITFNEKKIRIAFYENDYCQMFLVDLKNDICRIQFMNSHKNRQQFFELNRNFFVVVLGLLDASRSAGEKHFEKFFFPRRSISIVNFNIGAFLQQVHLA